VPKDLAITRQQPGDHITSHTSMDLNIQRQSDLITNPILLPDDLITNHHIMDHTIQRLGDLITSLIRLQGDLITSLHITDHTIQLQGDLITSRILPQGGLITRRNRIHRLTTSKDCCTSKKKLTPCFRRHTS